MSDSKKTGLTVANLLLGKLKFDEKHAELAKLILERIEALPDTATFADVAAVVRNTTDGIIDA